LAAARFLEPAALVFPDFDLPCAAHTTPKC